MFIMGIPVPSKTIIISKWDPDSLIHLSQVSLPMSAKNILHYISHILSLITRFMGPTWGPSGADRTQVGPMLAPWTLLPGIILVSWAQFNIDVSSHQYRKSHCGDKMAIICYNIVLSLQFCNGNSYTRKMTSLSLSYQIIKRVNIDYINV